jgi:outer membrane protein assembly factor BamB
MATDGQRVFASFVNGDVAAFDLTGNALWLLHLGMPENPYGHASSLAVHGDLLIVQLDQGSGKDRKSKLLAFRGGTGEKAWETARDVRSCWATPIIVGQEDQPRLLVTGDPWVMAYAPDEGREIWRVQRRGQDVASSPVFANGTMYVASEFPGLWAVDITGQGNVTETHVKWKADFGAPDTSSPLVANGLVLLAGSSGTLTCYDAQEGGEPLWEEEFEGSFSSSPSLAGDHVYLFGTEGQAWVIKPGRDSCQRVSEANLGEPCVTCPAFGDGRMYVRGAQHLFCIGEKK